MTDILILQERVKNSIRAGESDFVEFKSAWEGKPGQKKPRLTKHLCEDIAEALVAFANTDGGELLIGVEDDGTVSGVPHSEEQVQAMLQATRSHVLEQQGLPLVHAVQVTMEQGRVLFFQVEKGTSEVFQLRDGRAVARSGANTVPANIKMLQFGRQEALSRGYDRQYAEGALIGDLDPVLVHSVASAYLKGISNEKFLQQSGLAVYALGGFQLRNAALLLFATDISRWHPRSQVRVLKVDGTALFSGEQYNVVSDETAEGNVFELPLRAWEALRPLVAVKTEFSTELATFEQRFVYPEEALREAILNAVAHRDYSNHNGVEIYVFDDRIEIKSPGALLSNLTIDDLLARDNRHESRNARITYILKTAKFMREIGEGMKRIFAAAHEKGQRPPTLYSNTTWFTITLYKK